MDQMRFVDGVVFMVEIFVQSIMNQFFKPGGKEVAKIPL